MEACMCFPLLPETKRVANEIVGRQREREKEGVVINAEREDNPIGSAFIR